VQAVCDYEHCGREARYLILVVDLRPNTVPLGEAEVWFTGLRPRCEHHLIGLAEGIARTEHIIETRRESARQERRPPMIGLPKDVVNRLRGPKRKEP